MWPRSRPCSPGQSRRRLSLLPKAAQTQESLVRDALSRYQAGLEAIKNATGTQEPTAAAGQAGRPIRDMRMNEVVALALEKNLDIAVERINPSTVDLQIAGFKNSYLPLATSTVGMRDITQLPRDQLQGGQRVSVNTTTYNAGLTQNMKWWGGNVSLQWNNNKQDSSSLFSTFNPTFTTGLTATYTQPLLRGLVIDQTRQLIADHADQP